MIVDLHHGGVDAGAEALDLGQRKVTVLRGFAQADAELVAASIAERIRATQPAGRRPAELHVIAADRLQVQHRVEGGDLVDPDRRHVEQRGDILHHRLGDPATVLALREVEQRQHRARLTTRRVLGDHGIRVGLILGRKGESLDAGDRLSRHRSISPNTMSMLARLATASASMWPLLMWSRTWRWAKPGARILQR